MKKLSKLILVELERKELAQREMKNVKGGLSAPCECGCCYAGSGGGGSSSFNNGQANCNLNLNSPNNCGTDYIYNYC
jgi:natural product precursor